MFCVHCGSELPEGSAFCENCGAAVTGPQSAPAEESAYDGSQGGQVTPNIWLCPDGVYRWVYEYSMLKNPTILFTIWKVLGIGFAAAFLISTLATLGQDQFDGWAEIISNARVFAIIILVFAAISAVAYLIVAAQYGFKYIVLFEMDETGVKHAQQPKQFEKAEAMGWLTMMAGGSLSMRMAGYNAAMHSSISSSFNAVKSVMADKKHNVIKVNEMLNKNQVYAENEDFDFVRDYIMSRCVNAKKKQS